MSFNLRHLILLILVLGFCVILAVRLLIASGQAVELSILGNSAGQGFQNLSFSGDLLNVTLLQNGTAWNITAAVSA